MKRGKRSRKRREGVFTVRGSRNYYISYVDADGNRIRISAGTQSKEEAKAILAEKKKAARRGELELEGRILIKENVDKYLDECQQIGQRNVDGKRDHFRKWILPVIDNVQYRSLRPDHILKIRKKIIEAGRANSTANRVYSTFCHYITWSVERSLCNRAIRDRLRLVKRLQEPDGRVRWISAEEAQNLVEECLEPLKSVVITALFTGARRGELIGHDHAEPLRWDEVDLQNELITFSRTKSGKKRTIPISPALKEVLERVPRSLV